jgi:hypothetical protein
MKILDILKEDTNIDPIKAFREFYPSNEIIIPIENSQDKLKIMFSDISYDNDYVLRSYITYTVFDNLTFNLDMLNNVLHLFVNEIKKDPVKFEKLKDVEFSVNTFSIWYNSDMIINIFDHISNPVKHGIRRPRTLQGIDTGDDMSDIDPSLIPSLPENIKDIEDQYTNKVKNVYRFLRKGTIDLLYDKSTEKISLEPEIPFDPENIEWRTYNYILPEKFHITLQLDQSNFQKTSDTVMNIKVTPKILIFVSGYGYSASPPYFHFPEIKSVHDFKDGSSTYMVIVRHLLDDILKEKFESLGVDFTFIG